MADTDTSNTSGKPLDGTSAETGTRNTAGPNPPSASRAEAQAGDPYRPADGNDYALSIEPEDTGEATVANLFQAVPLEYEGGGNPLQDGEGLNGDGGRDGDGGAGSPRGGLGLKSTDDVPLPEGDLGVEETADGDIGDIEGIGDGTGPQARGPDTNLSQFDLGGDGIPTSNDGIGDGAGGGGGGGGGGPDNTPLGPLTDANPADNIVQENAEEGTTVGVVAFADDPDVGDIVSYEILDPNSPFVIDPVTGVISVGPNADIDREEIESIDVTVQATSSDGSTVVGTFTIQVGDDNTEFTIGPVTDIDEDANFVQENAVGGTGIDVTAFAEDPDATDTVSYEILNDSPFAIDPVTGVLTVADGAVIDREETPFIDVLVQATSTDGSTSSQTFRVLVGDENEFEIGPVTDEDDASNFVQENSAGGTYVGVTAFAEDPDATDTVTYEIVGDSPFVIDPTTGVITVAPGADIDRETTPFIDVTVKATSTDGSTSQETFRVDVGDENEFGIGPVTDEDDATNFVQENSDGGTVVGVTAFAEDPDATDTVTYEIVGDSPFVIDPVTGVITVAPGADIDRETTPFIDVTVKATSTDGSTSQETFRVDVGDENEFGIGPVTDEDTADNFVMENSDPGTVVGVTAFATDPDATDTVTYEIIGDSPFVIDPTTGVITVGPNADIDRETTESIDVTVKATSTDGTSSQETFTVQVGDENEHEITPVIDIDDSNNDLNAVAENGTGGEVVGITAFAEDLDATDTVTYSTEDPRFDIDPNTGVLTVKDGVTFDYEQTKSVDVEITATSTDGSSSTGTFTVEILDVNEAPDLDFDPELGAGVSVTTSFVEEGAGYSNSVGVFYMDANGNPIGGQIVWANHDDVSQGDSSTTFLEGYDAAEVGYFIIPDGADFNPDLENGDSVTFQKDGNGNWQAVGPNGPLTGQGANVLFSGDGSLNPDGFDQTEEFGFVVAFEDLKGGGDNDFDDVVLTDGKFETNAEASVYEEEFGAVVGDLMVTDPDEVENHTFDVSDDRFEVVVSGDKYVLKLKDDQKLDYETEQQLTIDVTVIDKGGLTDTETIVIDVIDINENEAPIGPLSDSDAANNFVEENSGGGTVVGVTAFAEDPDIGDDVVYQIVGDSPFEIDYETGVITVADGAVIDREATPTIDVTVKAISSDGTTTTKTFTVEVGDGNEFSIGPVTDVDTATNFVMENSDPGTVVGVTAFATDPDATDTVTYEIVGNSPFVINPTSGVITVAPGADIDRETTEFIDVTVKATSTDGSTSQETFRVEVGDENESDVGPVIDIDKSNNDLNAVAENGTGGEEVGITAFAEDPDADDTVTYSTDDPRFDIDPNTGVLTVKDGVSFDYEAEQTVDVDITATSTDGSTSTGTFTVNILDVNEAPDLIFHADQEKGVTATLTFNSEGAGYSNSFGVFHIDGNGDPVAGQIIWTNADELTPGETATVAFPGVDADDIGFFLIPDGADLNPDMEAGDMVTFQQDGDGNWQAVGPDGPLTGAGADVFFSGDGSLNPGGVDHTVESGVTIGFEDLVGGGDEDYNDFVFSSSSEEYAYRTSIIEEVEGAEAAPLSVIDPDIGDTHTFTVSDDRFEVVVSGDKYVLKLKDDQKLDYETETQVTVTVTATDSGGLSDTETIIIDVIDVNESTEPIGPLSDADDAMNLVAENSDGGTVVGVTAFATDPDSFDSVTYEIVDQTSPFVIDPTSGVITVAPGADIDRESTETIDVTVKATSTDGSSTTKTFTVKVEDENEFSIGPVSDVDLDDNAISELSSGGEETQITAFAEDKDATDTVTYELTGGNDRFEIDENTGVITVKTGANFDAETEPTVDVTVKATSTDGSSSSKTFSIEITDGNEPPDLVVEYGNAGINLIKNGSFETFDVDAGTWDQFTEDSSGAWDSDGKIEIWDNFGGVTATDGDQHLELDAQGEVNSISQTVETSLGQIYDLSFDVQARRDDDSNTVEVYWNGELVTTVDPDVSGWQTVELRVVGTGGDDVLEFRETSEDNNTYGAFIDNVELTGTERIGVVEEIAGADVVPLSVIDPDVGDTHTFTISDDRFEVVAADGKYLLKLKDDQALDYETETQVTLQVTATDQGGLSDTETIIIDVIDVDENTAPIGPLSDSDDSANMVAENSDGGTVVGVTAFATDPDVFDTVTYEIVDQNSPFVIDPTSGVITVAPNADIDRETTESIDVTVKATSTDGSSTTKTFTVKVEDENEFSIGPVSDVDTADNVISELSDGGEMTNITAFAEDKDATDTVTYELTSGDERFEIDENTGVIKVKDGAQFDAETEPTVDVTVKATSTDGSSSSKTFTVEVSDGNEAPDLIVHLENGSKQFIVNGSFEVFDGPLGGSDGTGWYENPNSIEGWSYNDVDVHQAGHLGFGATDGAHHMDLAARTNGWASQEIEGQLDGQVYGLSFDMKSRGDVGQSVAEVYWNGELIDTIDPATTGTGWQTYNYNIVGGSGDGSNTLTFVEIGSDNNGGALIDSVSIVSDNRTAVVEEYEGAEVAPLSVIDPDVGDTHTFTVSDDRFEVVVSGDKYMLKLKDDQALDYETETQVTLEVTATDQGGLSDTEIVIIDVIDIDDTNTPITDIIDTDATGNMVMENADGGTTVGLTAFANDPDAGDSVTYSITDPRFEIDPNTGVVTVADNAGIDHEQTPFIDLDVTATSTDGSSVTETFRINVKDDTDEHDVGPVIDIDKSNNDLNAVAENGTGGEVVGITAFAEDLDAGDTVTYSTDDPRFDIDPDTGVLTVKPGVSFDYETTQSVQVEITATSTDGSSNTGLFTVEILDVNEAPDLDFDPELGPGVSVTLTFVEEQAGYSNVLGVFTMDGNGNPVGGQIVWVDQNLLSPGDSETIYLEGVEADEVGYFLIPDGADFNSGLQSGDQVTFEKDGDGNWQAVLSNGTPLVGQDANVYFSGDGSLNPDGYDHTTEMGVTIGFEDLYDGGDEDFDDVVFDQTTFETTARAAVYEEQAGAEVGKLTVTDPDAGDTHTFTVSDDRFEVVEQNGAYVLKLKDSEELDYETETQVSVTVTATDSGGLSDTETIVIDVIDVEPDNDNSPVGPVRDADQARNLVAASAAAGAVVGLTAIAQDADAGDIITYSIDDSRFDIDEDTGVVTVADGATLTPGQTIDVVITATSSDGSQSNAEFPIDVVAGNNAAPDLIVGNAVNTHNYIKNGSFEDFTSIGKESGSGDAIWYGDAKVDHWKTYKTDIHSSGWEGLGTTDGDHRLDLANEHKNGKAYQKVYDLEEGETYLLSIDIRHRGEDGDAAVKIYWDGKLIDTVVPLDQGEGWNTYTYEVVAGDGHYNKLMFKEVGDSNYKGTQIDNVRLTDMDGISVVENVAGAEVVALSVVDPDVGDTHTFTVSDDRFEVVSDGDAYLLKLKDDIALDYEAEQSITLDVTATDRGGLSDTETITLDVVDVDDRGPIAEYGTNLDDVMVGGDTGDALYGRGGDDTIIGQGGNDFLSGGSGNDVIRGGEGDDRMIGDDGSDVFAYMAGDGNDAIFGGAGGSWIDIIDLADGANGSPIGEYGTDWSVTMTEGSIDNVDALNGEITLSQDSGGYIELADGGRVDFSEIEGIQY